VQVRKLSRILMLMIGAFLSACSTQTERGSSGPGAQGRTVAPSAKPQAKTQAQPKAQEPVAAATPVPEFVSEPEPADMVPVPPSDSFAPESADDRVSSPSMFYEEEQGAPKEEGIVAENRYHEEEAGVAKDDGIIAQSVYGEDESGVAPEEGITGRSMYYEEEEAAPKEEDIIAQSQ